MSEKSFAGKVALVTGAASGMGRSTAILFAEMGAKVVVADISDRGGHETVDKILGSGGEAYFVRADISDGHAVESLIAKTVEKYGRVDCACNAAAIDIEKVPLAECEDEIFDRVVGVNLRGAFLCLKHEINQMLRQSSGGAIVNIASVAAFKSRGDNIAAYIASKAGLVGLTRNAALRYARDGIRINTVCPGAIDTPMLRSSLSTLGVSIEELGRSYGVVGRVGRPDEIAEAVVWLCSERASFTVGCVLPVDGGALAR